jgi:hypothetical protein
MRNASRGILIASVVAAFAFPATALATQSTTINAANAPTGTHLKSGSAFPTCTVSSSLNITCGPAFTLAGVGNTNATANLSATYSATVVCINGGGNPSDSQHQGTFPASASSGTLQSKNGNLTVPQLMVTAPTQQQFLAQQTCPNPNWTPTIPGGIHLSSFTYTVSFVGFSGPYITISGNDP